MVELIPSFVTELEKLARVTAAEKVTAHHLAEKKDWSSFEQNLASPAFRRAVLAAKESDPKLKKYVKTFGAYKGSKDVVAEITSASSGKTYVVKDLHNGRLGCNCKDWQFSGSLNNKDCKHIRSVKQSKLVKESAAESEHRAVKSGLIGAASGLVAPHIAEGITNPRGFRASLKTGRALMARSGKGALGSGLVGAGVGYLASRRRKHETEKLSSSLGVGFTMTRRSLKAHEKGKKMKAMARELSGPRDPGNYLPWDERLMRGSL